MSIKKGTFTIASSTPVTEWGSIEGTLSEQADITNALATKAPLLSPSFTGTPTVPTATEGTDTNQVASTKFVNKAITNALENVDVLPNQTSQSGKFLTTNGSDASWSNIPAELPSQTGQSGKVLSTNGSTPEWIEYTSVPEVDDTTIKLNTQNKLQALGIVDRNTGNAKYDWVGTYSQWVEGRENNTIPDHWICYITDDYIPSTVTHNIGDIFYSMRTENIMNGAVVCDGSEYNIADFSLGNISLKSLLDDDKIPYVSISNFDATVLANGSCRCFGYDGEDTFKVPKLNDVFIEAGVASNNSEFIEAGLPNFKIVSKSSQSIQGQTALAGTPLTGVSGNYGINTSGTSYGGSGPAGIINEGNSSLSRGTEFGADNSIYGNSDTVQPNSVKYRAFIQLANATSESALQTVSSVVNDVEELQEKIEETVNYKNITNCITEIPQDIKLELNTTTHTLTLKAGSKVYIPNGVGVFDEVIIQNDLSYTFGWGNVQFFVYLAPNNNLFIREVMYTESGSTSTLTTQWRSWYDTNNNIIKWTDDYGSTWQSSLSLPLALITCNTDYITSIDQVFNGFGYIGSTVFALPDVKGLIPNGRNEDGTLKNRNIITSKVSTFTMTGSNEDIYSTFYLDEYGNLSEWWRHDDLVSEELPDEDWSHVYIPSKNEWWYRRTDSYSKCYDVKLCTLHRINGVVKGVEPIQTFRALNWGDKEYISSFGMPSGKWLDISSLVPIDGVGHEYVAPTNGYIFVTKRCAANNEYLGAYDDSFYTHYEVWGQNTNMVNFFVPLKRNQKIIIRGNASGADFIARFMYAEGEI